MDVDDEAYESPTEESDDENPEIDYSSLYNEEDIDEDLDDENSDSDSDHEEEVLPENNHTKFNIISNEDLYLEINKNNKKLNPYLTKFEIVKVLALRAEQIENGSPVLITVPDYYTSSKDIAQLEYDQKKIPFIIRRYTNIGYEDWKLEEFLNY